MYNLECLNWGEGCNSENLPEGCPKNCPCYSINMDMDKDESI
jgi:hypothetical protein